jgi:hypothetical protein
VNEPVNRHPGYPHQRGDLGDGQETHLGQRWIPRVRLPRGSIVTSGH